MRVFLLAMAAFLSAASAQQPANTAPAGRAPAAPRARVWLTTAEHEQAKGRVGYPLALPFADAAEGNGIANWFKATAVQAGGGGLADLHYGIVFQKDGVAWECSHPVRWQRVGVTPPALPPEVEGSKLVTKGVTDWVRRCAECRPEPMFVVATRWEHQFLTSFIPPVWNQVFADLPGFTIYEDAPVCGPLTREWNKQQPHVIEATFFPVNAPVMPVNAPVVPAAPAAPSAPVSPPAPGASSPGTAPGP
jgi:hypothetical protein